MNVLHFKFVREIHTEICSILLTDTADKNNNIYAGKRYHFGRRASREDSGWWPSRLSRPRAAGLLRVHLVISTRAAFDRDSSAADARVLSVHGNNNLLRE